MKERHKVTFDFDGTLTQPKVQELAKLLISFGIDVYVLTYRYNELLKHKWVNNPTNEDMYTITDQIGIKRENIIFTNFHDKHIFLKDSHVLFHIDDCPDQLKGIFVYTDIDTVDAIKEDCVSECLSILRTKGIDLNYPIIENFIKSQNSLKTINKIIV